MIIYVWANGMWCFDHDLYTIPYNFRRHGVRVDLDRLYDYKDLTPVQIKACEEALSE